VEVCSARMAGWLLHGSLQVYTPPPDIAHGCLLCDMSSGVCLVCVWLSGCVIEWACVGQNWCAACVGQSGCVACVGVVCAAAQ
jgi:hypothetical protein